MLLLLLMLLFSLVLPWGYSGCDALSVCQLPLLNGDVVWQTHVHVRLLPDPRSVCDYVPQLQFVQSRFPPVVVLPVLVPVMMVMPAQLAVEKTG
jgi:hypothetical protein